MRNFGKAVVKSRFIILVIAAVLILPSVWGMANTRVNYDMLTYLPSDIETMKGQDILENQFGTGAISMMVVDGMENKDVEALKQKILAVDHVKDVYWYDSIADLSVPVDALPQEVQDAFFKNGSTLMFIVYDTTTSSDATMKAVSDIRGIANQNCFLAGVTAVIVDTKNLTEQEEPIYVGIAVALAFIVLMFSMDTFLAPVFFLLSIGMAILYNMGTNIFFGQISYITKAISAVLQLGVTMDYSIFLWHSFEEYGQRYPNDRKRAMAHAISNTLQSVIGSSVTTIAGFIALCFMSFSFGLDIGLVMAKGVLFGVLSCVTILPSMILISDSLIEKTKHKPLIPKFSKLPGFVAKHYRAILIAFVIIWIPAVWGYMHTGVYYELDKSLPKTLASVQANEKLKDTFDMSATHMVLADNSVSSEDISEMCDEMKNVEGVKNVLGIDALLGSGFPKEMLPDKITDALTSDQYQLIVINSEYKTASDAVNAQIDTLNTILKKYDPNGMLIGDAPCTKDLITISNHDLNVVNWVSIVLIFLIVLFVFKSFSLPVLLVTTIEFAIFINMGIPGFTGTQLPFIASIVIGTIQLGSTVDYAILMTSRYQKERSSGKEKVEAITIAHKTSIQSIFVSGLSFFAATFGVGMYSNISIISSMCILMARGALISMVTVIMVLPAVLTLFDPIIVRTSRGFLSQTARRRKARIRKAEDAA